MLFSENKYDDDVGEGRQGGLDSLGAKVSESEWDSAEHQCVAANPNPNPYLHHYQGAYQKLISYR